MGKELRIELFNPTDRAITYRIGLGRGFIGSGAVAAQTRLPVSREVEIDLGQSSLEILEDGEGGLIVQSLTFGGDSLLVGGRPLSARVFAPRPPPMGPIDTRSGFQKDMEALASGVAELIRAAQRGGR
jgi:hypothetical protein